MFSVRNTLILLLLLGASISACKMKKINQPVTSKSTDSFYLTPFEQLDRLVKLDPNAPTDRDSKNRELIKGLEPSQLNKFVKDEYADVNKHNKVPSLAHATAYLDYEAGSKGFNRTRIILLQKQLWLELDPIKILNFKVDEIIRAENMDPDDSFSKYILTRLSSEGIEPKNVRELFLKLPSIEELDKFDEILREQYVIPESYKVDFDKRFDVGDLDPEDILRHHGFRTEDPSPKFKSLKKSFRDELLRYSEGLSYEQKVALYKSLEERIASDDSLADLRGQALRKRTARKIPFSVLMEAMVENRSVFGPYLVKKIQQEYSRINSMNIALDDDVQGFLKKSQVRDLSSQESQEFLQKARKIIPSLLGDGSKVLQAGSLGIVFENHEGKIIKWVPYEVTDSLKQDKAKYLEIIDGINAGQGIEYPDDIVDAGLQAEYRRRLTDEWQIKIDEIDEFIAETDLNIEVKNGENLRKYDGFHNGNKVDGEIVIVAGRNIDPDSVDSKHIPDKEKRIEMASRFNIQDKASGEDLKWFNDPKNHSQISRSKRIQIQNSLQKLMEVHLRSMFSGNYFHGDLHEGNIRVELFQDGSRVEVNKINIIDLGTVGYLDTLERQALKGIFDLKIASKLVEDENLIDKILYYNYTKLSQKHREFLVARDDFNFTQPKNYQEAEIEGLDKEIKYYMTGLSKDGFNFGVDGFKLKEYRTFLEIFNGKPIPDDSSLRLLGLRSNVVALFKATSTATGVVNASNVRAGEYVATGEQPKQIAQKSVAELMDYLGDINAYNLRSYQAELLVDMQQMDRSRSGINPEMIEYIKERRARGAKIGTNPEDIWADILKVEADRVAKQSELEQMIAERNRLSEQLESTRKQVLDDARNNDLLKERQAELKKQIAIKDEKYQASLSKLTSDHQDYTSALEEEISKLSAKNSTSENQLSELRSHVEKMEKDLAAYKKMQQDYTDLQLKSQKLQSAFDEMAGIKEKHTSLEQINKDLKTRNAELDTQQKKLQDFHKKQIEDLNSKMESTLVAHEQEVRLLQENQKKLSEKLSQKDVEIAQSKSVTEAQLKESVRLNEELAEAHLKLRRLLQIEKENTQLKRDLREIGDLREKNNFLNNSVDKLQAENSKLVEEIALKDSKMGEILEKQKFLDSQVTRLQSELEESISQEEKKSLNDQLIAKNSEIEELKAQLSNRPTSDDVKAIHEKLLASRDVERSLKSQIEQLSIAEEQLHAEKRLSTQIRGDLEMKELESKQLKENLETEQTRAEHLSRELETRKIESVEKIERLQAELNAALEKREELDAANTENKKLQQQIADERLKYTQVSKKIDQLKGEHQASLREAQVEIDRIKSQLTETSGSEDRLKSTLSEIEKKMEDSKKEFANREKTLNSERQNLEAKIRSLNGELRVANKQNLELQKKVSSLQAELSESVRKNREFNNIESRFSEAKNRLVIFESREKKLRKRVDDLVQERDDLRALNSDLQQQLDSVNSDFELMKQNKNSDSNWEEFKVRLEESEARNIKLSEELAETKARLAYFESEKGKGIPPEKKVAETQQVLPEKTNPNFSSARFTPTVININKNRIYNGSNKGFGALYFGIGASLISSGAILINEGIKKATPDQ